MALVPYPQSHENAVAAAVEAAPQGVRRIAAANTSSSQIGTGAVLRVFKGGSLAGQSAAFGAPMTINGGTKKLVVPATSVTLSAAIAPGDALTIKIEKADGTVGLLGAAPADFTLGRACSAGEVVSWPQCEYGYPAELDGVGTLVPPARLNAGSISGASTFGSTLTATAATFTGADTVATNWLRDGVVIAGQTGFTRVLDAADVGHTISFRSTATNAAGATTDSVSAGLITMSPPTLVSPGAISGTAVEGSTVTGALATFANADTVVRQWLRDGAAISGATGATFALTASDVGTIIGQRSRATNAGGSTDQVATVGPIPSAPPANVVQVNATSSIANDQVLAYTLSIAAGATAWQTWLVSANGGQTAAGEGYVNGQEVQNTGTPGSYTIDLSEVPAGSYRIWAKVNDGGPAQGVFGTKALTVTQGVTAPPPPPPPPATLAPVGAIPQAKVGSLMFREEFAGTSLNGDKWSPVFSPNAGQPTNQDLSNWRVADGSLKIWLRPNSDGNYYYWGRAINTEGRFECKYGYFEARLKLPAGPGTWPSFWLYREKLTPNAKHPEIDVIEAYASAVPGTPPGDWGWDNDGAGHQINYRGTIHYADNSGNSLGGNSDPTKNYGQFLRGGNSAGGQYPGLFPSGIDLSAAFHVYGALWEPDGVTFFFDGQQLGPKLYTSLLNTEMFLIVAMGPVGQWDENQYASISPYITSESPTDEARAYLCDYVYAWRLGTGQTTTSGSSSNPTSV